MFRFCTEGPLRYSEPAAQRRLICARAVTRFPRLEQELLHKRLTLTTLSLVASQLTEQNLSEVVTAIAGKSREFVEQYRAGFRPGPKAPREQIRPVVVQKPVTVEPALLFAEVKDGSASLGSTSSSIASEQIEGIVSGNLAFAGEGSSLPAAPEPRFESRFTIDTENHKKLQEAKALLLAKYPHGAGVLHGVREKRRVSRLPQSQPGTSLRRGFSRQAFPLQHVMRYLLGMAHSVPTSVLSGYGAAKPRILNCITSCPEGERAGMRHQTLRSGVDVTTCIRRSRISALRT